MCWLVTYIVLCLHGLDPVRQKNMSTLVDVAEEQRAPLVHNASTDENEDEIVPFSSSNGPDAPTSAPTPTDPSQRLNSLDVFRGLTVAVRTRLNSSKKTEFTSNSVWRNSPSNSIK